MEVMLTIEINYYCSIHLNEYLKLYILYNYTNKQLKSLYEVEEQTYYEILSVLRGLKWPNY